MEPIGLGCQVKPVVQPGKLCSYSGIVGAFVLAFHIERSRKAEEQLLFVESVGIALRGGHHPLWHVGESPGIEQRRDMPIIAEGLRRGVDVNASTIEDTELITPAATQQTVQLNTKVKSCTDLRGDGIQGVGQNDTTG